MQFEQWTSGKFPDSPSSTDGFDGRDVFCHLELRRRRFLYISCTENTISPLDFVFSGHEIQKKQINLPSGSIKTLGKFTAHISLHPEVSLDVPIEVKEEVSVLPNT